MAEILGSKTPQISKPFLSDKKHTKWRKMCHKLKQTKNPDSMHCTTDDIFG